MKVSVCLLVIFQTLFLRLEGRVNIINSYQPLYIEYGGNLTLTCASTNRVELEWVEETAHTSWIPEPIAPFIGGNTITRYTIEEPTGHVENLLIKTGMTLDDRGMYQCRDQAQENNFNLWVTVIYVAAGNIVAEENEPADLFCSLSGFESNLPLIEYHWYHKEAEIVSTHRYDVVSNKGVTQLTINKPDRDDSGDYTCTFTLQTTKEPVTFEETLNLDASSLSASSSISISCAFKNFQMSLLLYITRLIIEL